MHVLSALVSLLFWLAVPGAPEPRDLRTGRPPWADTTQTIEANDNRVAGGTLRDGAFTLRLETSGPLRLDIISAAGVVLTSVRILVQ